MRSPQSRIAVALLAILYFAQMQHCRAKILRNNALMTKMMSHFQRDNNISPESEGEPAPAPRLRPRPPPKPEKVLALMQRVLCKNFQSIPCDIIMQDGTLRSLIERSIHQIKMKKFRMESTPPPSPEHYDATTLFPIINSEDLSNFLQVSNTGYFAEQSRHLDPLNSRRKNNVNATPKTLKNFWSHEKYPQKKIKGSKDTKRTEVYTGRKKIRKFYPHKIKYKDKSGASPRNDFKEYSDEKLSMSVEVPDMTLTRQHEHLPYKVEPEEPPVWRIDYMKHGEPSLNMFEYQDDRLRGKIMKTGPSVVVDERVLEQAARKDVLHPDVYIKNNYAARKHSRHSGI